MVVRVESRHECYFSDVPESFAVLSSDVNDGEKEYQSSFDRLGYQVAIQTDFDIFGVVDISFQPGLTSFKIWI